MKKLRPQFCTLLFAFGLLAYSPNLMGQSSQRPAFDFSLRALRAEPGKPSLYDLHFTTRDTLDPLTEMVFEFPRELDLSQLQIASSTSINGGFKIFREGNVVRVRRTGLGETIFPGEQVELKLGLITSPPSLAGNLEIAFELRSAKGEVQLARTRLPIQFLAVQ
jgi:hypothetical protein